MTNDPVLFVIDLDGTLSNHEHRIGFAQSGDWDQFNYHSYGDSIHKDVAMFLKMLEIASGIFDNVYSVICSARPEKYRSETVAWLMRNNVIVDDILMRGDGDWRPDFEVKHDLIRDYLKEHQLKWSEIACVLEDRDKLVEEWRNAGLNCWQVREGMY